MFEPLNEEELDWLGDVLMKYGNDDSILSVSELDGYFTAIVSSPEAILPSKWMPAIWGGEKNQTKWSSTADFSQGLDLMMRHMNSIASTLLDTPHEFAAILEGREVDDEFFFIAEDWCFGYMRGADLSVWPELPPRLEAYFQDIALHGREENFEVLGSLSVDEHQQSVDKLVPAAVAIFQYFLMQRTQGRDQNVSEVAANLMPVKVEVSVGRNDPCPCGSGRKFKKCCLN